MLDVFISIASINALVFGGRALLVVPGLWLAASTLLFLGRIEALPREMEAHGPIVPVECILMAIIQDGLQYLVHSCEHRMCSRSHRIHHQSVHPCSLDAFHTGVTDALVQLLAPLTITLWTIRPNKTTAAAFGAWYSLWLQWIHSDNAAALNVRSRIFVTPSFHRRHHTHPATNLGHVFVCWDRLCHTASF